MNKLIVIFFIFSIPTFSFPKSYQIKKIFINFIPAEKLKRENNVGILINTSNDANEVYFNGKLIGKDGVIANHFVVKPQLLSLYRIPKEYLKFNRSNVIEIKYLNIFYKTFSTGRPFEIDNYWKLKFKMEKSIEIHKIGEWIIITFLIITFLINLLIYFKTGEKSFLLFLLIIFAYLSVVIIESTFFYSSGLKTPFIQKISFGIFSLLPWLCLIFLIDFYKISFRLLKLYTFISVSYFLCVLFFLNLKNCKEFMNVYVIMLFIYFATYIILIFSIYRKKLPYVISFAVGFLSFFILLIFGNTTAIYNIFNEYIFLPLYPHDYGIIFFVSTLMYLTILKFLKALNEKENLASKILITQEQERRKIASELHDSLGQSLLSIKFNLQNINEDIKSSKIENSINDLENCIENIRNISVGLRPYILDRLGIGPTLKYFSEKINKATGIKINLYVNLKKRPKSIVEENLFRIFQECLNNILKHSKASEVNIFLYETEFWYVMKISDNGKGFNYSIKNSAYSGSGLSIIEERVKLMNGRLTVNSKKNKGTEFIIEVPND